MSINNPKTIVITGASSGIGAALAVAYAAPKKHLLLIARHQHRLEEVAQRCIAQGATVITQVIDVTHRAEMSVWLQAQDDCTPIDLVIANAGCSSTQLSEHYQDLCSIEAKLWEVHLQGTLYTIHPIVERMHQRKQGQVAIMSSLNAFVPTASSTSYGAAKSALLHYGLSLRGRLSKSNIHVSVICPGWVDSKLTRLNKHPMPMKLTSVKAAEIIIAKLQANKAVIAFPQPMRWVTRLYHCLPSFIRAYITAKT